MRTWIYIIVFMCLLHLVPIDRADGPVLVFWLYWWWNEYGKGLENVTKLRVQICYNAGTGTILQTAAPKDEEYSCKAALMPS